VRVYNTGSSNPGLPAMFTRLLENVDADGGRGIGLREWGRRAGFSVHRAWAAPLQSSFGGLIFVNPFCDGRRV